MRIISTVSPLTPSPGASFILDSAASLSIGEQDGEEAYQLHRVSDAIALPDGRIVVANAGSSELRAFEANGHLRGRVGRSGAGPGEFAQFSFPRLYWRRGELLASDPGQSRLHAYDSTLTLLATRPFATSTGIARPQLRDVLADGTWLAIAFDSGGGLRGPSGSVIGTRFTLTLFDAKGDFLRRFGSFEGSKRYVNTVGGVTHYPQLPLTAPATVRAYGNQIVVVPGDRPEFELWDTLGTRRTVVRWNRVRTKAAELYPRYREHAIAQLETASERDRVLYGAFYEKDIPLPEFAAMYDDAVVDAARRIWVRRVRLPADSGPTLWDVLETSGRWLGTVATPLGMDVFRINENHLLGRVRDSLGVERVVQYVYRPGS